MPAKPKALIAGLLLAIGLSAPLLADSSVTALTAITTVTTSVTISTVGATTNDVLAVQAVYDSGTVTLEASLDGTNWEGALYTWTATKKVYVAPIYGGLLYRINVTACSGCTVNVKVTASGRAQVVTF